MDIASLDVYSTIGYVYMACGMGWFTYRLFRGFFKKN